MKTKESLSLEVYDYPASVGGCGDIDRDADAKVMPKTMEYIKWWDEHDREIAHEIRRGEWN
jgi:hypothetical protein